MAVAIIVDWYGPFSSFEDFKSVTKDYERGSKLLYMALGKSNIVRYIGLTVSPKHRFRFHENMQDKWNMKFFIGEIVSQGVSGKRRGLHPSDLKVSEQALIHYVQPELNINRKTAIPEDCVVVYSRFFDGDDWETSTNPIPKFPKVIAFNSWNESYD